MSDYFAKREAKAAKEAEKKAQERMVLNFIRLGKLPLEEIAECSGLTLKKIRMLATTL